MKIEIELDKFVVNETKYCWKVSVTLGDWKFETAGDDVDSAIIAGVYMAMVMFNKKVNNKPFLKKMKNKRR